MFTIKASVTIPRIYEGIDLQKQKKSLDKRFVDLPLDELAKIRFNLNKRELEEIKKC